MANLVVLSVFLSARLGPTVVDDYVPASHRQPPHTTSRKSENEPPANTSKQPPKHISPETSPLKKVTHGENAKGFRSIQETHITIEGCRADYIILRLLTHSTRALLTQKNEIYRAIVLFTLNPLNKIPRPTIRSVKKREGVPTIVGIRSPVEDYTIK